MNETIQLDIIRAIAAAGGEMTIAELAEAMDAEDSRQQRILLNAAQALSIRGVINLHEGNVRISAAGLSWADGIADRRLPLDIADAIARQLVADLESIPGVIRLEIAGSIRRRKTTVGDVELVALVAAAQPDLFGAPSTSPMMGLTTALRSRADQVLCAGPSMTRIIITEPDIGPVKVDLFQTCDPACWGMLYTIRTGSADWIRRMLSYWKRVTQGGECSGLRLRLPRGKTMDTPEEADVFRIISDRAISAGMPSVPYVPAERRTPL